MNQRAKLFQAIRNNPKDVKFADACKVAKQLGFNHSSTKGSHTVFSRPDEPVGLNFQNHGGKIPMYQARQLIVMIEKYGDTEEE